MQIISVIQSREGNFFQEDARFRKLSSWVVLRSREIFFWRTRASRILEKILHPRNLGETFESSNTPPLPAVAFVKQKKIKSKKCSLNLLGAPCYYNAIMLCDMMCCMVASNQWAYDAFNNYGCSYGKVLGVAKWAVFLPPLMLPYFKNKKIRLKKNGSKFGIMFQYVRDWGVLVSLPICCPLQKFLELWTLPFPVSTLEEGINLITSRRIVTIFFQTTEPWQQ